MVAPTAVTHAKPSPPRVRHWAAATREWRMCAATCAKRITNPSPVFERLLVKDITSSVAGFTGVTVCDKGGFSVLPRPRSRRGGRSR